MPKTKLIGRAKLSTQLLLDFSAYNLIRLDSLSGCWVGGEDCMYRADSAQKTPKGLKVMLKPVEKA